MSAIARLRLEEAQPASVSRILSVSYEGAPRGYNGHKLDFESQLRPDSCMDVMVRIPDEIAERLGTAADIERRVLEALALEEFKRGKLTRPELRRLLGFGSRAALDQFLVAHGVFGTYDNDDLARDRKDILRSGL